MAVSELLSCALSVILVLLSAAGVESARVIAYLLTSEDDELEDPTVTVLDVEMLSSSSSVTVILYW